MKKFLAISTIIFLMAFFTIGSIMHSISPPKDETYFTKTKGKDIYIAKDNKWEKLELVGVELDSAKPGVFPSENLVNEEDYLRWIKYIYDMGANCIKVSNLMGADFYNALYKFNKDKKNPIYLMQGIYFNETLLKNGKDPQGSKPSKDFKDNIKLIIDAIHGNPYNKDKIDILQVYKTDVSKYVIGYSLGIQFAKHDLVYTEIMNNKKPYNGEYMYTDKNASSFESYLAKMGDYTTNYEFSTYKKQSLISFIGTSAYHIASSIENPNKKNTVSTKNKNEEFKNFIDVENIKAKRSLKTGIIASYNIYPSYTELKEYEGNIEKYFTDINKHYSIPVIIGEIGIASSRAGGDFNESTDKGYITEQEQGKALVDIYKAAKKSKLAGCFIFEFQDSWNESAWNTKDNKILDRSAYWSDAQTYSQSFGLMTFEPGRLKVTPYPDDKLDEWSEKDIISKNKDYSLSMQNDEKYLYFMVKSNNNTSLKKDDIYIDLDTTPKSGSKKSNQYGLQFDKPVDFIININDKDNSKVMVQEYYNGFNFYENKSLYEKRPDLIKHTPDMDYFSPIYIETRPKIYIESQGETKEKVIYETGKLIKGNSNPESKSFNSVADYYMGDNYVEVRIPWGLLNFMDPSTKQIADDFYEKFKTRPMTVKDINIGMTIKENENIISKIKSTPYNFEQWSVPKYHERLKKSYYILKEELSKK